MYYTYVQIWKFLKHHLFRACYLSAFVIQADLAIPSLNEGLGQPLRPSPHARKPLNIPDNQLSTGARQDLVDHGIGNDFGIQHLRGVISHVPFT